MKRIATALLLAALTIAPAGAQTLKPVKDKASKLFGYQDETKAWVIEPQYENAKKFHGPVAQVMMKDGKHKLWGVIDTSNNLVIPIECEDVSISEKDGLIGADRYFNLENGERYTNTDLHAWGVYDLQGREIWAPQFSSNPYFNRNGEAAVTDKATLKQGIISSDGRILLPLENFHINSSGSAYEVLGPHLDLFAFGDGSTLFRKPSNNASRLLGAVPCTIPYNTDGDDVKAIAYGHRRLGEKLTRNVIFQLPFDCKPEGRFYANLEILRDADDGLVNWNADDRFIRLELAYAAEDMELTVPDPQTGTRYTVVANLYDPNGEFVQCLCPEGILYAELSQGVVYKTVADTYWFIAYDINWPFDFTRATLNVTAMIDNSNVEDMLGLTPAEKADLHDFWKSGRIHRDVELRDIGELQSYFIPDAIENKDALRYQEHLIRNYSFLFMRFRANQVYPVSSFNAGSTECTVRLGDELRSNMNLQYTSGFSYSYKHSIFWGVRGDRYIKIIPIPKKYVVTPALSDGVVDDRPDSKFVFTFEFRLYEDNGTFVQTLGYSDGIWFGDDDIVGFKGIDWVFTRREPRNGAIRFATRHEPFKGNIKDLDWVQF